MTRCRHCKGIISNRTFHTTLSCVTCLNKITYWKRVIASHRQQQKAYPAYLQNIVADYDYKKGQNQRWAQDLLDYEELDKSLGEALAQLVPTCPTCQKVMAIDYDEAALRINARTWGTCPTQCDTCSKAIGRLTEESCATRKKPSL